MRSDTSCGSKLPHLQVEVFKSLQIRSTIDLFCLLIKIVSITKILLCNVNAHFHGHFALIILANRVQFNVSNLYQAGKCTLISHSDISKMDKIKINEQKKSIVTGPLYEQDEFEAI